jgi:hypothetical protein
LIVRRENASNLTEYVGQFVLQDPGKVDPIAKIVACQNLTATLQPMITLTNADEWPMTKAASHV